MYCNKIVFLLVTLTIFGQLSNAYSVSNFNQAQQQEVEQKNEEIVEEGRGFGELMDVDKDFEAFENMFNALLWDADEDEVLEHNHEDAGRSFVSLFRSRGLFRMPMPRMFKEEGSFSQEMYRGFVQQCYDTACNFGLGGLARIIQSIFH